MKILSGTEVANSKMWLAASTASTQVFERDNFGQPKGGNSSAFESNILLEVHSIMGRFGKILFWSCSAAAVFCLFGGGGNVWAAREKPVRVAGELLVQYRTGVAKEALDGEFTRLGAMMSEEIPGIGVRRIKVNEANRERIKATLAKHPKVKFVEDNFMATAVTVPDDSIYSSQWHLPKISAPLGWDISTGTTTVSIAVIDSGVDPTHPDLAAKLIPGYNFVAYNTDTHDVAGHGTAVAGSAGALGDNGLGVAGVAWHNPIMPLVVLDSSGSGSYSAISSAITWAADRGAKVINLSLAGPYASSTLQDAVNYAWGKGVVIIAAAANEATSTPYYPAACDNVVAVSASDTYDKLASFSNYGAWIDVAAPGVTIYSTNNGGGYGAWNGTSFSSPITAGMAALIWSVNPLLSNSEVVDILKQGTDDLGAPGFDTSFGFGRINLYKGLTLALGYAPAPDTEPPVSAITAPAAGVTLSSQVGILVSASDNVAVSRVDFFVDGALLGSDQTVPYSVDWDAAQAADGWYTLTAVAYDAAGNVGAAKPVQVLVSHPVDSEAPRVVLVGLADGMTIGTKLTVQVQATDNVGISRLELYLDGVLKVARDGIAALTFVWNTRKLGAGAHEIKALAFDAAGNVGEARVTMYR